MKVKRDKQGDLSVVTINFVVWMTSAWYTKTATGLVECYLAALPFFKYRMAGDVCSVVVFFGLYTLIAYRWPSLAMEPLVRARSWRGTLLAPWQKNEQF